MEQSEVQNAARQIIHDYNQPVVMATVTPQGEPHVFFMGGAMLEEPFILYVLTYGDSHKVLQIRDNPHVQLMFFRPDKHEVLTITGQATIEDSRQKMHKVYQFIPSSQEYFSGPDDPSLCVLKITATRLELWMGAQQRQAHVAHLPPVEANVE